MIFSYVNLYLQITSATILSHVMYYGKTLQVYALKGLTRYYLQKVFSKRIDETVVKLCKLCPNLHTLVEFCIL